MSQLSIKKIQESQIVDAENNINNQYELIFENGEKTASITLEGKGAIKQSVAV